MGRLAAQRNAVHSVMILSSTVPGGGQNAGAGLLTALSFSWYGIAYDSTTANAGFIDFNASGKLVRAVFGTDCAAGCIVLPSTNAWAFDLSPPGGPLEFFYTLPGNAGLFEGSVTAALAVYRGAEHAGAIGIGCALVGPRRPSRRQRVGRHRPGRSRAPARAKGASGGRPALDAPRDPRPHKAVSRSCRSSTSMRMMVQPVGFRSPAPEPHTLALLGASLAELRE